VFSLETGCKGNKKKTVRNRLVNQAREGGKIKKGRGTGLMAQQRGTKVVTRGGGGGGGWRGKSEASQTKF